MLYIPIILGGTHRIRRSVMVAQYVIERFRRMPGVETELHDVLEPDLPSRGDRPRVRREISARLPELGVALQRADGIVVVTPEEKDGYPGALKAALDDLLPEYRRKPFGFVTVSSGGFGGVYCLAQLRLITLGMGAFPIPASLPISRVEEAFDEEGRLLEPAIERRTRAFVDEMVWYAEAISARRAQDACKVAS